MNDNANAGVIHKARDLKACSCWSSNHACSITKSTQHQKHSWLNIIYNFETPMGVDEAMRHCVSTPVMHSMRSRLTLDTFNFNFERPVGVDEAMRHCVSTPVMHSM